MLCVALSHNSPARAFPPFLEAFSSAAESSNRVAWQLAGTCPIGNLSSSGGPSVCHSGKGSCYSCLCHLLGILQCLGQLPAPQHRSTPPAPEVPRPRTPCSGPMSPLDTQSSHLSTAQQSSHFKERVLSRPWSPLGSYHNPQCLCDSKNFTRCMVLF